MKHVVIPPEAESPIGQGSPGSPTPDGSTQPGVRVWIGLAVAMGVLGAAVVAGPRLFASSAEQAALPPPPPVAVSPPLQRDVEARLQFLGQLSALENVELRAQVGGTLTELHFKDGDIVHKGDLLFVIDLVPYEIKLSQAMAQLESAKARLELATIELQRAEALKRTNAGSAQNVDQRAMEQRTAQAAVDGAKAQVRDAQFDLDHCRITAPFTGRIGTHLVSVGNLVAGSRASSSPTTLLATLVSLDPIYLNFDLSEADYMAFLRERQKHPDQLGNRVDVSLSDEASFSRDGTLDFIDNALNRSSGTIHARATIPNSDLLLTPGGFARVRLALSPPSPALLVPDAAVLADQSEHIVLTVGPNDTATPKIVKLGDIRGGLRVIRSGLAPSDRVIIDGIPAVRPGSKVSPSTGSIRFGSDRG
jgi:RND family efflux transporter MFP subunit